MTSSSFQKLRPRLVLACMAAIASGWLLLAAQKSDSRVAASETASREAAAIQYKAGRLVMGDAYMATSEHMLPGLNTIIKFGNGLHPFYNGTGTSVYRNTSGRGAFAPLNEFAHNLALAFIPVFALISVLVALFKNDSHVNRAIAGLAIHLFTVLVLLWAYPVWDNFMFNGVTLPLVTTLQTGTLGNAVLSNATKGTSSTVDANNDFIRRNAVGHQIEMDCALKIEEIYGASAQTVVDLWAENADNLVVSPAAHQIFSQCASGMTLSNEEELLILRKIAALADDPATNAAADSTATPAPTADTGTHRGIVSTITTKLSEGLWSVLLKFENLIFIAVTWFMWIGFVVGRALSVALAPVPLAWSMFPGCKDRAQQWFASHAKLLLQPVGFSVGFVVFYAVQAGIMTTPAFGTGAVGFGLRLFLTALFLTLVFKLKDVFSSAGGDVAKMAGQVGTMIRDRAAQVGVAAVAGGAGSIGGAIKAGQLTTSPMGALKAAGGAARASMKEAGVAMAGSMAKDAPKPLSEATGMHSAFKPRSVAESYRKGRDKSIADHIGKTKGLGVHESAEQMLSAAQARREEREREAEEMGLVEATLAPGEKLVAEFAPGEQPTIMAATDEQRRMIEQMAQALSEIDVDADSEIDANGRKTLNLSPESMQRISQVYADDPRFARTIDMIASLHKGTDKDGKPIRGIPTVEGPGGKQMPHFGQLADSDALFAQSVALSAILTEKRREEMHNRAKRQKALKEAGHADFTPTAIAVAHADSSYAQAEGEDTARRSERMENLGKYACRLAYASRPEGMAKVKAMGLDTDMDIMLAKALDKEISALGWDDPDVLAGLTAQKKQELRADIMAATQRMNEVFSKSSAESMTVRTRTDSGERKTYGLNMEAFRKSAGQVRVYDGDPSSRYMALLSEENADDPKRHEKAFKKAFKAYVEKHGPPPDRSDRAAYKEYMSRMAAYVFKKM